MKKPQKNNSGQGLSKEGAASISEVYLEHETFLKRFVKRYLFRPQDIEDVVQETFLKAFNAEKKKEVIESPKAFLFRIAKNTALRELTKKSNQITGYIEDIEPPGVLFDEALIEDYVAAHEKIGVFCEAAASLPQQCRRVFLLRKVYGFSHREISERLGISTSTVEKHLAKGMYEYSNYVSDKEAMHTELTEVRTDTSPRAMAKKGQ